MLFASAINLHRKSGEAERRDLRLCGLFMEMFFERAYPDSHFTALTSTAFVFLLKNHMTPIEAATLVRKSGQADLSRRAVEGSGSALRTSHIPALQPLDCR